MKNAHHYPFYVVTLIFLVGGGWFAYYIATPSSSYVMQYALGNAVDQSGHEEKVIVQPIQEGLYSSKKGIALKPPAGWVKRDNASEAIDALFLDPKGYTQNGYQFYTNLSVVIENSALEIKTYIEASKKELKKNIPNYNLIEEKRATIGGVDAVLMIGAFTQNNQKLQNAQLITVKNGQAFVVTATTLAETWKTYESIFNSAFASIVLQ